MRLIDADALKKDDEVTEWITKDAIRTGKMLKAFSELFVKKIDAAPTIQAIPIDVLDKIRAEIADLEIIDYDYEGYYQEGYCKAITDVSQIIDKYRKEQE